MINLNETIIKRIKADYDKAINRFFFFDYDGTLVPFYDQPDDALPDHETKSLLKELSSVKENSVVIISGRTRNFLDKIFSAMEVTLIAEHGFFIREPGKTWRAETLLQNNWKTGVREVLLFYRKKHTGSMIEEKESTIAWHYRNCNVVPTVSDIESMKVSLHIVTNGSPVEFLHGNNVLEIKKKFINKGSAAVDFLKDKSPGFILALGDDITDEDLFSVLPETAVTIKVGNSLSVAKYSCHDQEFVTGLIRILLDKP
jgi:trehalose 6-phosphate synthase/phosphatase